MTGRPDTFSPKGAPTASAGGKLCGRLKTDFAPVRIPAMVKGEKPRGIRSGHGPVASASAKRRRPPPQALARLVLRGICPADPFHLNASALHHTNCQIFIRSFFHFLFTQKNEAPTWRVLSSAQGRRYLTEPDLNAGDLHMQLMRRSHVAQPAPLRLCFPMK